MAKWGELSERDTVIVEMAEKIARLDAENRTIREVNAAQADNYTSLARQLADREEQLRKAQERIRAAEAERDRAWNEAIEAAVRVIENGLAQGRGVAGAEGLEMVVAAAEFIAEDIRSLAKEAGE
jgi:chromosome segregation ATPase